MTTNIPELRALKLKADAGDVFAQEQLMLLEDDLFDELEAARKVVEAANYFLFAPCAHSKAKLYDALNAYDQAVAQ